MVPLQGNDKQVDEKTRANQIHKGKAISSLD